MTTSTQQETRTPAWASWLGVVAVLLGVLLASWHANEWMRWSITGDPPFSVDGMPEAACEEDELAEEGLTLIECRQMALSVHDLSLSSPSWFRDYYMGIAAVGFFVSLFSIYVGIALVDFRRWAPMAGVLTFGALAAVDAALFIGVVNTGPLVRQLYLWNVLIWFALHAVMVVAAFVGRESETAAAATTDGSRNG